MDGFVDKPVIVEQLAQPFAAKRDRQPFGFSHTWTIVQLLSGIPSTGLWTQVLLADVR
jgi:hypothetical protein